MLCKLFSNTILIVIQHYVINNYNHKYKMGSSLTTTHLLNELNINKKQIQTLIKIID